MDSISIPGPFKFFHTYNVPPIEVQLPLVVSAHVPTLVFKAIISVFGALLWLPAVAAMVWSMATSSHVNLPFAIPLTLSTAALGWGCAAFAFKCVRLALRPADQLVVTADEVIDRRQDARVSWTNVRHMSVESGNKGWHTIRLDLYLPVAHKEVLFDLYARMPGARAGDRIDIGIRMLNERSYILVHAIAALVRRHGGTTAEITQWGWE